MPMRTERLDLPGPWDPLYAGHFPGRPLIPGALLLDAALRAIGAGRGLVLTQWELAQVKFLAPTAPGAALHVAHQWRGDGALSFLVRSAEGEVARGLLRRAAPPPDAP